MSSLAEILQSIPQAASAWGIVRESQTLGGAGVTAPATAAAALVAQLNRGEISAGEFQDLLLDVKNQLDADQAVENLEWARLLSNSFGLLISVASRVA
jgi:hypothetical protein